MRVFLLVATAGALALVASGLWQASNSRDASRVAAPARATAPPATAEVPAAPDTSVPAPSEAAAVDEAAQATLQENERQAIQALRKLALAQERHRQAHGRYAPRLAALEVPETIRAAGWRRTEAHHGYQFVLVERREKAPMDPARDFAVLAIPQVYGGSGLRSFAVQPDGAVLAGDTHGRPLADAGKLKRGWALP